MSITLNINTSLLKHLYYQVMDSAGGLRKNKMINIRATYEKVELSVQGVFCGAKAEVDGEGDIIMPAKLLKTYLDTCSTVNITLSFAKGQLKCGASIYETSAIDIMPLGLRPHLEVAINPTRLSTLRYALTETDEKQIQMKGLATTVTSAKMAMKRDIQAALTILEKYDVTHDDLEKIVISRILNK